MNIAESKVLSIRNTKLILLNPNQFCVRAAFNKSIYFTYVNKMQWLKCDLLQKSIRNVFYIYIRLQIEDFVRLCFLLLYFRNDYQTFTIKMQSHKRRLDLIIFGSGVYKSCSDVRLYGQMTSSWVHQFIHLAASFLPPVWLVWLKWNQPSGTDHLPWSSH